MARLRTAISAAGAEESSCPEGYGKPAERKTNAQRKHRAAWRATRETLRTLRMLFATISGTTAARCCAAAYCSAHRS